MMSASGNNKNVIVFGETGSGKSSLVNLLLRQDEAKVSDKAVGCTFNFKKYETPHFNLYDTVGLSEGREGTLKQSQAIKQLVRLLKSLEEGVSLLVFVIEKGRIKKSMENNYRLFIEGICMKKVPVVLGITHCEMENERGQWWNENKEHFDKYGMTFDDVVSGTALRPTSAPRIMQPVIQAMNRTTAHELSQAINLHLLAKAWKFEGGWMDWFSAILQGLAAIFLKLWGYKTANFAESTMEQRLFQYFQSHGLTVAESIAMAKEIVHEIA
ncbi:uncharacterized protein LOC119067440 [Bradysia coprophila]|uniref:uncharacterized protein LOC119067440 n=1 Tax=Bradysia coprophila TaxID=38358 RepID=UPI00187DB3DB|nr:uncharacterized protein LOC119067440 [Bradysia coprophila]